MEINKNIFILGAAIVGTSPVTALASSNELSYDFFQVTYTSLTADLGGGYELDGTGFGLAGSWSLNETAFITAGYSKLGADERIEGLDVDYDETDLTIALGGHWPMSERTDVLLTGGLLRADVDASIGGFGSVSDSDTGYSVTAGFRSMVSNSVELFGNVGYVDIFDDNGTSYSIGGRFAATDNFSVVLAYNKGDDVDGFGVAGRIDF